jgi:hypothetical protein
VLGVLPSSEQLDPNRAATITSAAHLWQAGRSVLMPP